MPPKFLKAIGVYDFESIFESSGSFFAVIVLSACGRASGSDDKKALKNILFSGF